MVTTVACEGGYRKPNFFNGFVAVVKPYVTNTVIGVFLATSFGLDR